MEQEVQEPATEPKMESFIDTAPKASRPRMSGTAQREIDKMQAKLDAFEDQIKSFTMDNLNKAPRQETELKVSDKEIAKSKDIYLKPVKTFPPAGPVYDKSGRKVQEAEKFNEKWRKDWEYDKEYVPFTAQNNELIGETLDLWTKPYPGVNAEEWQVPTNKPVWGPRHLAEQIKRKRYTRLVMQETRPTGADHAGQYIGQMVAESQIQRLDCHPVNQKKSIFMGASGF